MSDLTLAARFLARLDEEAHGFYFQTFPDNVWHPHRLKRKLSERDLTMLAFGSFERAASTLTDLNSLGAGIFVSVNRCKGGRKLSNVVGLRAVFAEIDSKYGVMRMRQYPAAPSMIVESSLNKFHVYWLLDDASSDMKNLPLWNAIERKLVDEWGSDSAAMDASRVLRVPSFLHQKDLKNPWRVSLLSADGGPVLGYDINELSRMFAVEQKDLNVVAKRNVPTRDSGRVFTYPSTQRGNGGNRGAGAYTFASARKELADGQTFHSALRWLSVAWALEGYDQQMIQTRLECAMNECADAVRASHKWQQRFNQCAMLARTAYEKFGKPELAQIQFG